MFKSNAFQTDLAIIALEKWIPMHPNEEVATSHTLKRPRLSDRLTTPACFITGMQRDTELR